MNDPYREQCFRCLQLQEQLQQSSIEIRELKQKNKMEKNSKIKEFMFKFWTTVLVLGISVIGGFAVFGYIKKPKEQELCHESFNIVHSNSSLQECNFGGKLSTEPAPNSKPESPYFIVRCICPTSEIK